MNYDAEAGCRWSISAAARSFFIGQIFNGAASGGRSINVPILVSKGDDAPLQLALDFLNKICSRLVLIKRPRALAIETLGEAWNCSWRIHMRCLDDGRRGLKHGRECAYRVDLDLTTLVCTRGRDFPTPASRIACVARDAAAGESLSCSGHHPVMAWLSGHKGEVGWQSQRRLKFPIRSKRR